MMSYLTANEALTRELTAYALDALSTAEVASLHPAQRTAAYQQSTGRMTNPTSDGHKNDGTQSVIDFKQNASGGQSLGLTPTLVIPDLSTASMIYMLTTSFLLDQVRQGVLNDQRILRIHIVDKERDKILVGRNIQVYPSTGSSGNSQAPEDPQDLNQAGGHEELIIQKDPITQALEAKIKELESNYNYLLHLTAQHAWHNSLEKEGAKADFERMKQENAWLRGKLEQSGQRQATVNDMWQQQQIESWQQEKQSLQSQLYEMKVQENKMKVHQEGLDRNITEYAQRSSAIEKLTLDIIATVTQQSSTIEEIKRELEREQDITDATSDQDLLFEQWEMYDHADGKPTIDGTSNRMPKPISEHNSQPEAKGEWADSHPFDENTQTPTQRRASADSAISLNEDEASENTTALITKSAENSPISLDRTSKKPEESTISVVALSTAIRHVEMTGLSPIQTSKQMPEPNKAQAVKDHQKSSVDASKDSGKITGHQTPQSTSKTLQQLNRQTDRAGMSKEGWNVVVSRNKNKAATHHPKSPHAVPSELGQNSLPRAAASSSYHHSKSGSQGYSPDSQKNASGDGNNRPSTYERSSHWSSKAEVKGRSSTSPVKTFNKSSQQREPIPSQSDFNIQRTPKASTAKDSASKNTTSSITKAANGSPPSLDDAPKATDPKKYVVATCSSNSVKTTERLFNVPEDARKGVKCGAFDPKTPASNCRVQLEVATTPIVPETPTRCRTKEYRTDDTVSAPDMKLKSLSKSQRKKRSRRIRKIESIFEKEREEKNSNAVFNELPIVQEVHPSSKQKASPSPLKKPSQKESLANFRVKLDQLRRPPAPENPDEFLDHCINLFTHLWEAIPQFYRTEYWGYLTDHLEQILHTERNFLRVTGFPTSALDPDALVTQGPEFLKTRVSGKALSYLIKLGKCEFGIDRILLALQRSDLENFTNITEAYELRLTDEATIPSFADTFLEALRPTCSPRLLYLVCRQAGCITRKLREYRILKGWFVIESPKEGLLRSIFDGESEDPVYSPPPCDEYGFEDLYIDVPKWQKKSVHQAIDDDSDVSDIDTEGEEEDLDSDYSDTEDSPPNGHPEDKDDSGSKDSSSSEQFTSVRDLYLSDWNTTHEGFTFDGYHQRRQEPPPQ